MDKLIKTILQDNVFKGKKGKVKVNQSQEKLVLLKRKNNLN